MPLFSSFYLLFLQKRLQYEYVLNYNQNWTELLRNKETNIRKPKEKYSIKNFTLFNSIQFTYPFHAFLEFIVNE